MSLVSAADQKYPGFGFGSLLTLRSDYVSASLGLTQNRFQTKLAPQMMELAKALVCAPPPEGSAALAPAPLLQRTLAIIVENKHCLQTTLALAAFAARVVVQPDLEAALVRTLLFYLRGTNH